MAVSFRGPRNPGPYVWNIICVSLLLSMSLVSSTVCCCQVALEINMYNITTFDTIFAYLSGGLLYLPRPSGSFPFWSSTVYVAL
ncbi:hypothetical protein C8F04DRAFT_1086494, partial [Mycena alexandri]